MEFLHSIILGITQGITEFLPISSSAHLVLLPYLFKWNYQGLNFDIALHLGTVIAIVAYFWKDWTIIIRNAFIKIRSQKWTANKTNQEMSDSLSGSNSSWSIPDHSTKYPPNLLCQILVASIPAAIVGFLIKDYIESTFHSPLLLAINLAVFGIILWAVDRYSKKTYNLSPPPAGSRQDAGQAIGYKQSFYVGLMQSLALIPGVSRSGITMVASRSLGLNRESAAKFSFLLGTPAMLGAFLLDLKDLSLSDITGTFLVGVFFSTIFGLLAIRYLLQYLKRGSFSVFSWYRIVLAVIVLGIYFAR